MRSPFYEIQTVCPPSDFFSRSELRISQRELADRLQLADLDIDKNAIQRIECGKRFVTDIEIVLSRRCSRLYGRKSSVR